jgi:hypothetical protein
MGAPNMDDDETISVFELQQKIQGEKESNSKQNPIDVLRSRIERTKHDYDDLLKRLADTGKISTDALDEVELLYTHSLSASVSVKVPCTGDGIESMKDMASYVLAEISSLPKPPSLLKDEHLQELNRVSKKTFQLNSLTFFGKGYCGTPDAVLYEKGQIKSVAEFKRADQKNAAIDHVRVYLHILGLKSGWVCLDVSGDVACHRVHQNETAKLMVVKKEETYTEFKKQLCN